MAEIGAVNIRPMRPDDMAKVMAIENASFTDPWPESSFSGDFDKEFAYQFVAETRDKIIAGYTQFWIVIDEGHILNIAVSRAFRRLGIGRKIMNFALQVMSEKGVKYALLEVRKNNMPALNLYKSMGFRKIAVRKKYYSDGADAIIMLKYLEEGLR